MGCVYQAKNKMNGKRYIGKTTGDMNTRRVDHEKDAMRGVELYFHRALRKYGFDCFEWSVLENDNEVDRLNFIERKWIKKLNTKVPNGYNLTDGGDGDNTGITQEGRRRISEVNRGPKSVAVRAKLSEARKRVCANPTEAMLKAWVLLGERMKGSKHSDKTKSRMSFAAKGKAKAISHRESISKSLLANHCMRGKTYEELYGAEKANELREMRRESRKNKRMSTESVTKLRESLTGRKLSKEHKINISKGLVRFHS